MNELIIISNLESFRIIEFKLTIKSTEREWIASVSCSTSTEWLVINNRAFCVLSTHAGTRILTFILCTHLIRRAIRIDNTCGSTLFVWITNIIRWAITNTNIILFFTYSVRTANISGTGRWFWTMYYNNWKLYMRINYVKILYLWIVMILLINEQLV